MAFLEFLKVHYWLIFIIRWVDPEIGNIYFPFWLVSHSQPISVKLVITSAWLVWFGTLDMNVIQKSKLRHEPNSRVHPYLVQKPITHFWMRPRLNAGQEPVQIQGIACKYEYYFKYVLQAGTLLVKESKHILEKEKASEIITDTLLFGCCASVNSFDSSSFALMQCFSIILNCRSLLLPLATNTELFVILCWIYSQCG